MAATAPPRFEARAAAPIDADRAWRVPAAATNAAPAALSSDEEDLAARWRRAAIGFLALVEGVPAALRERPGACGEWSVREVAAHCAGWEWEGARRLRLIAADPARSDAVYDVDRFNGASVAVRANQGWAQTLDELAKASATFGAAAAALPDDPRTEEWLRGRIADFEEHSDGLRRWLAIQGTPARTDVIH